MILPLIVSLDYVCTYGVNLGWADSLDNIPRLLSHWSDGTLAFEDFWNQHNEHRVAFPRLILLALAIPTRWNVWAELLCLQMIFTGVCAALLYAFRKSCGSGSPVWWVLPVAFLSLSLRQHENMLNGWQITFMMTTGLSILTFLNLSLLNEPGLKPANFLASVSCAGLATISSAQGLLVWPVGIAQLLLASITRRSKIIWTGAWLALGCLMWVVYFHGYTRPENHPGPGFSWLFLFAYLGGALFTNIGLAVLGGFLLTILAVVAVVVATRAQNQAHDSFWLALIFFGSLVQLQTTVGRTDIGLGQALASRYATFALLSVLGTYGILSVARLNRPSRGILIAWRSLVGLAIVGLVQSTVMAYQVGAASRAEREYRAFVFLTADTQPDAEFPSAFANRPADLRRILRFLKAHELNLFASPAAADRYELPSPDLPQLGRAVAFGFLPPLTDKAQGVVRISGWACSQENRDLVGGVFLKVEGKLYQTYYGVPRSDAANSQEIRRIVNCGFTRSFSAEQLGPGRHRLEFVVLSKERKGFLQPPPPAEIEIDPSLCSPSRALRQSHPQ